MNKKVPEKGEKSSEEANVPRVEEFVFWTEDNRRIVIIPKTQEPIAA